MFNKNIINKQKILFFKKLLLIIILLFIFDYIIGLLLKDLYFSQISGDNYRITYALEKTEAEIIIFGSSRAKHHYIPQIFTDKFNLSCYNVGRGGHGILFNYALLKGILKRHKPKIVILDILPSQILKNNKNSYKLNALLPYYKDYKEIRSIIELQSKMEKIKLLSKIYPYNSLLITSIRYRRNAKNKTYNGYSPLKKVMEISQENEPSVYEDFNLIENFDLNIVKALESFITESKNSGAKIYLIISPTYGHKFLPKSMEKLEQIARKHNISFLDYSDSQEFETHPELFQDRFHLNENGAELFSTIISNRIFNKNPINID